MSSLLSPPEPGVRDFEAEIAQQAAVIQDSARKLRELLAPFGLEGDLQPRPGSLSLRSLEDRQNYKIWIGQIHALPASEQQRMPTVLRLLAWAGWALGEYQSAQRDFHNYAEAQTDPTEKAWAFHQAYLAALERPHLADALYELKFALALDPHKYAPFPLDKYDPEKFIAADGFGLLVRCKLRGTDGAACVRTVDTGLLATAADTFLSDCQRLKSVGHPNVLKIGSVDSHPSDPGRLVLLVEYLEGSTLESYVQRHGALNTRDTLSIAGGIAQGLHAAHSAGITHRGLRPSCVNVQRLKSGVFNTIVGDFGIVFRAEMLREAAEQTATFIRTLAGRTKVGALDFVAPEQLGKVAGEVGPAADVYAWAKTLCYMLFQTPHPAWHHWQNLPEGLAPLLHRCLAEQPDERPAFSEVLAELENLRPAPASAAAQPTQEQPLVTSVAPPPGVGLVFEPKKVSGMPSRRRLGPIDILKIRIRRLTFLYTLIGLTVALVGGLIYVIFFYGTTKERFPVTPVAGILTCMGEPVADAKLTFYPDDRDLAVARGVTDSEGRFTLTTHLPNDGAYPGGFRVTVVKERSKVRVSPTIPGPDPRNPLQGARNNPLYQLSQVHDRYMQPQTTPLRVTIPKEGNLNLELRLHLLGLGG